MWQGAWSKQPKWSSSDDEESIQVVTRSTLSNCQAARRGRSSGRGDTQAPPTSPESSDSSTSGDNEDSYICKMCQTNEARHAPGLSATHVVNGFTLTVSIFQLMWTLMDLLTVVVWFSPLGSVFT